jgi:signal transduction histidine kinase/CheY-like chemotaxis protein
VRRWFQRLPIHRKLVVLALAVTGVALAVAIFGLSLFDVWRYRVSSTEDAAALAGVLAENSEAAVVFDDAEAALEILRSVSTREVVVRACIYLPDGRLFAGFARTTGERCAVSLPDEQEWPALIGTAPITRNGRTYGSVYVERNLSDLAGRLFLTAVAALGTFLIGAIAALIAAQRVHGAISDPISRLAGFARQFGSDRDAQMPRIETGPDEVGDLAASFAEMVTGIRAAQAQIRQANLDLTQSNDALRRENEERRRIEGERAEALIREREASRLKDEFLAAVSHELRTPLNAMMGWAQLLAGTKPSEQTIHKAVSSIVKNAHAQTRVIEDLLDVSRIVTGKLRLSIKAVDLRSVISLAIETIQPAAAAKQVRIQQHGAAEPFLVSGDTDRLHQVLWNLLSNAVKFTPAGGWVSVELTRTTDAITIRVSDSGVGISAPFVPHVFERFRQADGSMSREHGGLGLGLAIVKELTELHGGSVRAHSEGSGRGATFTLTFPALTAGAEPTGAAPTSTPPATASLSGVHVLAVDDNEDSLLTMAMALSNAGARVDTARSGAEALALWSRQPADVLVCDLAMPQMNGLELLERIRQLDAAAGRLTPAIAVSAHAAAADHSSSLRHGFSHHLAKPFSHDMLVRMVAAARRP